MTGCKWLPGPRPPLLQMVHSAAPAWAACGLLTSLGWLCVWDDARRRGQFEKQLPQNKFGMGGRDGEEGKH